LPYVACRCLILESLVLYYFDLVLFISGALHPNKTNNCDAMRMSFRDLLYVSISSFYPDFLIFLIFLFNPPSNKRVFVFCFVF